VRPTAPATTLSRVMSMRTAVGVLAVSFLAVACSDGGGQPLTLPSAPATLSLSTDAFSNGGALPPRFTCDGLGVSPRLAWSESKPASEFVLLVTDPDAPGGSFVHWVVYGIPSNADSIGEGQGPAGATQGENDFGRAGYGAPCPPPGDEPHGYVFTMYALSSERTQGVPAGADAEGVLDAIRCCVQEQGSITGTYER
jgi:Raf kinase inhibitor-like YbhB/YbcL family protein